MDHWLIKLQCHELLVRLECHGPKKDLMGLRHPEIMRILDREYKVSNLRFSEFVLILGSPDLATPAG